MRLALRELRRRPGRFVTATVILWLIGLLVLLFGGILDALLAGSTNGLLAQRGDVIVLSSDAQSSLARSRIDAQVRRSVEGVPGVSDVGGLGLVQLAARVPGQDPRDLADTVLFGYETPPRGVPDAALPQGAVIADSSLQERGVEQGAVLRLGPARSPVQVVGFVDDTTYLGAGSLWGSLGTWRSVLAANRPDAALPAGTVEGLVVSGSGPASELAARIDAATGGATRTLTLQAAAEALPGVEQQTATFNQIIGTIVAVALLVVALFFVLLTVERTSLYGVLKALGASSGTLFAGVLLQAVVVALVASALATAVGLLLVAVVPPGAFPFELSPGRVLTTTLVLLVASAAGCAFSLRRVLRVDPASAIGGTA